MMIETLKILWNKLTGAMLAVIAIAFGSFILFFVGKRKGKEEEKAKRTEDTLKTGLEIKADDENRRIDGAAAARTELRKTTIDR